MKINEQSILIVDDVPKNIQLLGSILKEEAYDLEFATSGKEALEWLDSKQFDLVLLDIMMPEMDGFEVCRRIKENPLTREVSVIFLTAKADFQSIIQGFESGAVDYITKPYNRKELLIRVKTHLTLQQQRKQLEQSTAFEKKIFSIIGHDLRSPMGNIRTYIDAYLQINNNSLDESVLTLLKDLYLLSDNAFNLLENLLNWAKTQSGGIICRPQQENIAFLVKNVLNLFALQADNKQISLKYEGEDIVEGYYDPELISVVIRNLVSNSLKFTPHGGSVIIRAHQTVVNNTKRLLVSVTDTGTGMSAEVIDNLINKNIHYTTYGTDNEKGSGLGFQLCKEFVALNGGSVWIESALNEGSVFYVSLPASATI